VTEAGEKEKSAATKHAGEKVGNAWCRRLKPPRDNKNKRPIGTTEEAAEKVKSRSLVGLKASS
ncbi:MAG: hypothetical protein WAM65_18790, partial [Candidatus Korobacteraceae bacterium]